MKKTVNINLAGMVFVADDDAYERLAAYLDSIKSKFASDPDRDEIIADIENRIAEQLAERGEKTNIVTLSDVENVISSMGNAEDFENEASEGGARRDRKLMRDTENGVIAGVASGLAAYFAIDPWIVRGIFFLSLFIGGGGVIAYLLLWLLVPEARTAADKLLMRGDAINLASIANASKNRAKDGAEELRSAAERFGRSFGKIVRFVVFLVLKIAGFILTLASILLILASTFAFASFAANANSPYFDFPLAQVMPLAGYLGILALAFLLAVIPAVLVLLAGLSIFRRASLAPARVAVSLIGVWIALAITAGVLGLRFGPEYAEKIAALPQFQTVTETQDLRDFTKLDIETFTNVKLTQGDFAVTTSGRRVSLEALNLEVKDGTLYATRKENKDRKVCFSCAGRGPVELKISMPQLESATVGHRAKLMSDAFRTENLALDLDGGSADLNLEAKQIALEMEDGASAKLSGKADRLVMDLSGWTYFFGKDLLVKDAELTLSGQSHANVNVNGTLNIKAGGDSSVIYQGAPKITSSLYSDAWIESAAKVSPEDNSFEPYYRPMRRMPAPEPPEANRD